jgi:deoxyhypusine synthase
MTLPDAVVAYIDSTVALPLVAHYALARRKPRKLKRLYDRRGELLAMVLREYRKHNADAPLIA